MTSPISAILASVGLVGTAITQVVEPGIPVTVVPLINLGAIVVAAVGMGMLINRVRTLEREVREIRGVVFQERPWEGVDRRIRPHRTSDPESKP